MSVRVLFPHLCDLPTTSLTSPSSSSSPSPSLSFHFIPDDVYDCEVGDVVVTQPLPFSPSSTVLRVCFIISSVVEATSASYVVKISRFDGAREDSHLIKFPNGLEDWLNLTSEHIRVHYVNGELISPLILNSSQVAGINVRITFVKHTSQINASSFFVLKEDELKWEAAFSASKAQHKVEDENYIQEVRNFLLEKQRNPDTPNSSNISSNNKEVESKTQEQEQEQEEEEDELEAERERNVKKRREDLDRGAELLENGDQNNIALSYELVTQIRDMTNSILEIDSTYNQRCDKLENEVKYLKSLLLKEQNHNHTPSPMVPVNDKQSPPTERKRGRPPKKIVNKRSYEFHVGETIVVRADIIHPQSMPYWMARVLKDSDNKPSVRVKWFEPFHELPGWYYLDNKEDVVDVETVIHRNFEWLTKPHKLHGQFIDVFRPTEDFRKYDN